MNLRFRFGLLWKRRYWMPTVRQVMDTVATVVALVALYLSVAYLAIGSAKAEAETAAMEATSTIVTLLNGQAIQSVDGHWAARCTEVVEARQ